MTNGRRGGHVDLRVAGSVVKRSEFPFGSVCSNLKQVDPDPVTRRVQVAVAEWFDCGARGKAVTRGGCFGCLNTPRNFREKLDTQTVLVLSERCSSIC